MKRILRWSVCVMGVAVSAFAAEGDFTAPAVTASTETTATAVPRTGQPAPIQWHTRFETARTAALAANRPMLLEFWAGWCEPCVYMDAHVYSNPQVAEAMKRLVPVRVDLDAQGRLARTYNVDSIPTLVFTDSHGNELFRYSGLLEVGPMVQLLRELPVDISRINKLSQAIAANKTDVDALATLGGELRRASLYRASNSYLGRALASAEGKRRSEIPAILLAMGQNHLDLKENKEAVKLLERCVREFPGTTTATEAAALLQRR